MPETVRKVGEYTVAIGEGTPKQGDKNALSPIYRSVSLLAAAVMQHQAYAVLA